MSNKHGLIECNNIEWREGGNSIRKIKNSLWKEPKINCNTNTGEQFLFIYYCVTFCGGSTHYWQTTMQPQTQLFSHFSKRRLLDQVIFDSMRELFRQEIKYSLQTFYPNMPCSQYRFKHFGNYYLKMHQIINNSFSTIL